MKNIKTLAPIVLAVLVALSFYKLYSDRSAVKAEYTSYVTEARKYAEQGIIVDAIDNYSKALQMNDTLELSLEVGKFYVDMKDIVSAIGWGEMLIEKYPKEPAAYDFLVDIYLKNNDYNSTYALIDKINGLGLSTKKTASITDKVKYLYFFGDSYEDAGSFNEGLCTVMYEEAYGAVDTSGSKSVPFKFQEVGTFIDGVAPVKDADGSCYYVDKEGNKKIVIKDVKDIKKLGNFGGEYYPVCTGAVWNYYNTEFKKVLGDYQYASTMANGFASVMENSYYYIIDTNGKKLTNQKYDGIVEDYKGIIFRNNSFFVEMDDGLYYLLDSTGKKVTNEGYISAELFLDETYAAVETEKGWCFIDNTGKKVFGDLYFEEANSFSNGFATVKKDGMWGFINIDGEVAIDYSFEDAHNFSPDGTVFVKQEDIWTLLLLYSHNYES